MVLIGELVKALNLYANPRVGNHSHVNKNSNARGASKKFWMQKAHSNWVILTWSLCFIAILFVTIVLWFLFSLFLGFALHNIHAFHLRLFLFFFVLFCFFFCFLFPLKKRKKKGSKLYFALFSWFWKQGWSICFHITCLLYLVYLWWAYLLHLTSWSLVVHVVWEKCLWFWSPCLDLEVTCLWLSDFNLLRRA